MLLYETDNGQIISLSSLLGSSFRDLNYTSARIEQISKFLCWINTGHFSYKFGDCQPATLSSHLLLPYAYSVA
jgi:hypothetical protein